MSENVELTRLAFQGFEDRDLDTLLAMLDDDVEVSGGKMALRLFELLNDFLVAAVHLMRHAPDVDRSKQGETANTNAGRPYAGNISPPFTSVTEGDDAADVDVDALWRIDVDVAEDHERTVRLPAEGPSGRPSRIATNSWPVRAR
jgi:hypothetical protein